MCMIRSFCVCFYIVKIFLYQLYSTGTQSMYVVNYRFQLARKHSSPQTIVQLNASLNSPNPYSKPWHLNLRPSFRRTHGAQLIPPFIAIVPTHTSVNHLYLPFSDLPIKASVLLSPACLMYVKSDCPRFTCHAAALCLPIKVENVMGKGACCKVRKESKKSNAGTKQTNKKERDEA